MIRPMRPVGSHKTKALMGRSSAVLALCLLSTLFVTVMGAFYVNGRISSTALEIFGYVAGGIYLAALALFGLAYFKRDARRSNEKRDDPAP